MEFIQIRKGRVIVYADTTLRQAELESYVESIMGVIKMIQAELK